MAAPMRVGILNDMSNGPPGPSNIEPWLRTAADELSKAGRLDRDVEFVHAWGLGLPSGTAAAVERAFAELVADEVLLIVGPAIGDNALVATPLAERHRVPAINWAGAERARGQFMFHLQVGSHEDESVVLARHLAATGAGRVGVVHDRSPIGTRHLQFFQAEADRLDLHAGATAAVAPLADNAAEEVSQLIKTGIDAFAYLGLGLSAPAVARALTASGWQGPRVMNTAGIRGYDPAFAKAVDGWVYVDMHSDHNRTLAGLRDRPEFASGNRFRMATGYDLGRLAAEGLARAPELTREGVRQGLEQIKWLPAAQGYDGTLLGFGPFDRAALHGRYLVLRRWENGKTMEVV